jgi:hypothetical protein
MNPTSPFEEKDSFSTTRYRSGWIRTCHNRTRNRDEVSVLLENGERISAKSVRGAKCIITRHIGIPPHWKQKKTV